MEFSTFAANSPAYSPSYPSKSPKQRSSHRQSGSRPIRQHQNYQINDPTIGSLQTLRISSPEQTRRNNQSVNRKGQRYQQDNGSPQDEQIQALELEAWRQSLVSKSLSEVSVPMETRKVFPGRLAQLEGEVMKEILELRQQKITLMEHLNKQVDIRNLYEEEIQRLERTRVTATNLQDSPDGKENFQDLLEVSNHKRIQQPQKQRYVPEDLSVEALKKNDQLKLKLKQINIKREIFGQGDNQSNVHGKSAQQGKTPSSKGHAKSPSKSSKHYQSPEAKQKQQQLLDQIAKYREANQKLEQDCTRLSTGPRESQSRLFTFLPADQKKHFAQDEKPKHQGPSPIAVLYNSLIQQYNSLLEELESNRPPILRQDDLEYLNFLREQNQRLTREVENMLVRKSGKQGEQLNLLRAKVQQNERQKQLFLQDLEAFKSNMIAVKAENSRLKKQGF